MRVGLENCLAHQAGPDRRALGGAGRTERPLLARERKNRLLAARSASYPCEISVRNSTVKILADHALGHRTPASVCPLVPFACGSQTTQTFWNALRDFFKDSLSAQARPGAILTINTAGQYLAWMPHIHGIAACGGFLPDGSFEPCPRIDANTVRELFEAHVFSMLREAGLISHELVDKVRSWRHSGFDSWIGPPASDMEQVVQIGLYAFRAPRHPADSFKATAPTFDTLPRARSPGVTSALCSNPLRSHSTTLIGLAGSHPISPRMAHNSCTILGSTLMHRTRKGPIPGRAGRDGTRGTRERMGEGTEEILGAHDKEGLGDGPFAVSVRWAVQSDYRDRSTLTTGHRGEDPLASSLLIRGSPPHTSTSARTAISRTGSATGRWRVLLHIVTIASGPPREWCARVTILLDPQT